MSAAPLTLERAHAIDAPFTNFDDWADAVVFGNCTACGYDAFAGMTGWWHETTTVCPGRPALIPTFAAEEPPR